MRHTFAVVVGACLIGMFAARWTAAQQPRPVSESTAMDEVLQAVRADLQGDRADIIAKNLTLDLPSIK